LSLAKYAPALLVGLALCAPVLIGMQDNSIRPAQAEAAIVKLPPGASASPPPEQYASPRSVTLPMEGGHYWADAKVNSAEVRFLVDTGASIIALTKEDARRIGVSYRSAREHMRVSTANGVIEVPVVTLKRVRVGKVEVANVRAVVVEEGLDTSLLGMSFLGQLKTWQTTQAGLVLKQ
jgi:aspartyl protease family protein